MKVTEFMQDLCRKYARYGRYMHKNSYTLLFPLLRRPRSEFEPRRMHHKKRQPEMRAAAFYMEKNDGFFCTVIAIS